MILDLCLLGAVLQNTYLTIILKIIPIFIHGCREDNGIPL